MTPLCTRLQVQLRSIHSLTQTWIRHGGSAEPILQTVTYVQQLLIHGRFHHATSILDVLLLILRTHPHTLQHPSHLSRAA